MTRPRLGNPNSLMTTLLVCAVAVVLNVATGTLVGMLALPFLFLDTLGTFVASALFGVRWGVVVGVLTNVVLALVVRPQALWFIPVQVLVAVVVGLVARRDGYTPRTAPIAAALLAVLVPLVSTIIVVAVFKGGHGNPVDDAVAGLQAAGNSLFSAAFWPRAGLELVDKAVTAFLALVIIKVLPEAVVKQRVRAEVASEERVPVEA